MGLTVRRCGAGPSKPSSMSTRRARITAIGSSGDMRWRIGDTWPGVQSLMKATGRPSDVEIIVNPLLTSLANCATLAVLDRTRGTEMTTLNAHNYFNVAITIAMLAEFVVCILIVALYVLA